MASQISDIVDLRTPLRTILLLNAQAELLHRRNISGTRRQAKDICAGKKDSSRRAGNIREWIEAGRKRIYEVRCSRDADTTPEWLLYEIKYRTQVESGIKDTVGAMKRRHAVSEQVICESKSGRNRVPWCMQDPVRDPFIARG